MKESVFHRRYEAEWLAIEQYLQHKSSGATRKKSKNTPENAISDAEFPRYYRRLCNHLALAQTRRFSQPLVNRLNNLVMQAHHLVYQRRGDGLTRLYVFFLHDFPNAVRREKKVMLWALAAFAVPMLLVFLVVQFFPAFVYSLVGENSLTQMEILYTPNQDGSFKLARDDESNVMMFGIYILNNISIALRGFASGLLMGVGSLLTTAYNGIYMGGVFSHLQNLGHATQTLYPFVITHSAFEITALIISAGAGLRLGLSFLLPGRHSRGTSIALASRQVTPIVIGFVAMLFIAALIEAFWSALDISIMIKYIVGGVCWLFVLYYFCFVGRSRGTQ